MSQLVGKLATAGVSMFMSLFIYRNIAHTVGPLQEYVALCEEMRLSARRYILHAPMETRTSDDG